MYFGSKFFFIRIFFEWQQIILEFKSGIGDLDFLFIAKLKNEGFAYFCVEFKNAHSDKLEDGLLKQLPTYMNNKKAQYGAYCVLDYRGDWFDQPRIKEDMRLAQYLSSVSNSLDLSLEERIRTFIYNLSKPKSASKR